MLDPVERALTKFWNKEISREAALQSLMTYEGMTKAEAEQELNDLNYDKNYYPMTRLEDYLLNERNWDPEWLKAFSDDVSEDDRLDAIAKIEAHDEDLTKSKYLKKSKDSAFEEGKKQGAIIKAGTVRRQIAKTLGIDATRSELERMDDDAFVSLVETKKKEIVESASQLTDQNAKSRIDELQEQYQKTANELSELKASQEEAYEEMQKEAESKIEEYKVGQLVTKTMSQMPWADHVDKEAGHLYIDKTIREKYKVQGDGTILNPDGTKALSIDGRKIYNTYEEAYQDIFTQRGYNKRSNAGTGESKIRVNNIQPNPRIPVTDQNAVDELKRARQEAQAKEN